MAEPAWKMLDEDEFRGIMIALGYATGAAAKQRNDKLAAAFLQLADALNLGNPNYRPYRANWTPSPKGEPSDGAETGKAE